MGDGSRHFTDHSWPKTSHTYNTFQFLHRVSKLNKSRHISVTIATADSKAGPHDDLAGSVKWAV